MCNDGCLSEGVSERLVGGRGKREERQIDELTQNT